MFLYSVHACLYKDKRSLQTTGYCKDPADFHRLNAMQHGKDDDNALTERSSLEEIANSPNSLSSSCNILESKASLQNAIPFYDRLLCYWFGQVMGVGH